jgi:hypothetical protein
MFEKFESAKTKRLYAAGCVTAAVSGLSIVPVFHQSAQLISNIKNNLDTGAALLTNTSGDLAQTGAYIALCATTCFIHREVTARARESFTTDLDNHYSTKL